jgi:small subunit ribosomal protein S20
VPHSLSSKKRERQNVTRRARNRSRRSALRTRLRRCADTLTEKNVENAEHALRDASQLLDREADRGLIHKNAAARQKSRMAKRLNALKQAAAS